MFRFNGSYDDVAQVAPFIGEYAQVRQTIIERTGRTFVYNDELKGQIPGIANTEKRGSNVGTHEDAAIYLLQGLFRAWEQEARILDLLAEGYDHVDELAETTGFANVVLYSTRRMGGEWAEFVEARVVPEGGKPYGVLRKGKRTRGTAVGGRRVLARKG